MIKGTLLFILTTVWLTGAHFAQQPKKLDAAELVGVWQVDLRTTPDAPPYYQKFEVKVVDGSTFTGTFYQTEIKNGRLNTAKGAIYFAFTTEDNSGGAYNTFGKLVDGRLEGATHAINRKFLLPWTGTREK